LSVDPGNAGADVTDPQTWNGYGYVLGNPLGLVDPSGMSGEYSGIQGGPGYCPPSQATCPTGQPPVGGSQQTPSEINVGEAWYVNNVVVPGYLSGIPNRYPGLVQFSAAPGSTSTTIYYGLALLAKLSADGVGISPDVEIGSGVFQGQQQGLSAGTAAGRPKRPGTYKAYASCLAGAMPQVIGTSAFGVGLTATAGRSYTNPVPPPEGTAPPRLFEPGLKWGPKGQFVGALIFLATYEVELSAAAQSCSSTTGYTPLVLEQ